MKYKHIVLFLLIFISFSLSSCLTSLALLGAFSSDSSSSSSSNKYGDYLICYSVNGAWTKWYTHFLSIYGLRGYYDEISIVDARQPWVIYCHFKIYNFNLSYKKGDSGWVKYNGIMEYYVDEYTPTITDSFKHAYSLPFQVKSEGTGNRVKRTANAIIKIQNYSNVPQVYNVFFDDVGFGLDLNGLEFK